LPEVKDYRQGLIDALKAVAGVQPVAKKRRESVEPAEEGANGEVVPEGVGKVKEKKAKKDKEPKLDKKDKEGQGSSKKSLPVVEERSFSAQEIKEIIALLPEDAPEGHEAFDKVAFVEATEAKPAAAHFAAQNWYEDRFRITVAVKRCLGSREAALRICRATYVKMVGGASKEDVIEFKNQAMRALHEGKVSEPATAQEKGDKPRTALAEKGEKPAAAVDDEAEADEEEDDDEESESSSSSDSSASSDDTDEQGRAPNAKPEKAAAPAAAPTSVLAQVRPRQNICAKMMVRAGYRCPCCYAHVCQRSAGGAGIS